MADSGFADVHEKESGRLPGHRDVHHRGPLGVVTGLGLGFKV